MNALLRGLGALLYYVGLAPLVRWLNRGVPRVLAYHACEDAESQFIAGLRCNTTPDVLRRQLDQLVASRYNVISVERLERGPVPPYAVAITFDDGYRSVFEQAFPLLRQRSMPATVYLIGCTMEGRLVWVNEINWLLRVYPAAHATVTSRLGLDPRSPVPVIIAHLQARHDPGAIETLLDGVATLCGADRARLASDARLYLSAQHIEEMQQGGVAFGSHTYSHPNLALLSARDCRGEIDRGAAACLRANPKLRPSFAYPFGLHSPGARLAAREHGSTSVMEIGGWNRPLDLSAVARVPVYATTEAQFFAELEVISPVKWALRRALRRLRPESQTHRPAAQVMMNSKSPS